MICILIVRLSWQRCIKNNHKRSDVICATIKENNSLKVKLGSIHCKKKFEILHWKSKKINGPDLNQTKRKLKWRAESSKVIELVSLDQASFMNPFMREIFKFRYNNDSGDLLAQKREYEFKSPNLLGTI